MRHLFLDRPPMKGSDVAYLKRRLRKWGLDTTPGNVYDEQTARQVRFFRSTVGLGQYIFVDEPLWAALQSDKLPPLWDTWTDELHRLLSLRSIDLIGTPYLHGGGSVFAGGYDSLGFITALWQQVVGELPTVTMDHLKEAAYPPMSPPYNIKHRSVDDILTGKNHNDMAPFIGGLALYSSKFGHYNHCMYILNEVVGVGAVGGNRHTRSVELAAKRDACVKVKNLQYRPGLTALVPRDKFRAICKRREAEADDSVVEDANGHQGNSTRVQG